MPGLVGPTKYPIRDPKDPKQSNGRILNPVRYTTLGGLDGPGKWPKADGVPGVERATNVKGAKSTTGRNAD